jgi:GAF domain-containing protein
MTAQSADFAEEIAELKGVLLGSESVGDFLLDLAVLAPRELGEDLSCGIMLQPRDRLLTVASSDVTAAQVDEVQYSLYQGPCLHSIRTGEHVRIDDLVFDQRWWEYAVRALARGVRSSLSIPVSAQSDPVGSINLYSDRPRFFDDTQTQRAEQFAAEATDAVGHAVQLIKLWLDSALKNIWSATAAQSRRRRSTASRSGR